MYSKYTTSSAFYVSPPHMWPFSEERDKFSTVIKKSSVFAGIRVFPCIMETCSNNPTLKIRGGSRTCEIMSPNKSVACFTKGLENVLLKRVKPILQKRADPRISIWLLEKHAKHRVGRCINVDMKNKEYCTTASLNVNELLIRFGIQGTYILLNK